MEFTVDSLTISKEREKKHDFHVLVNFAVALVWFLSFTCLIGKSSIFGTKFETTWQIIPGEL